MITRRVLFVSLLALAAPIFFGALPATAAAPSERYVVELRVIEAGKGDDGAVDVDKRLSGLAKDLKTLPFKKFDLKDAHTSLVQEGERVSLEIPVLGKKGAKDKKRFLVVAAHGRQSGGKLRFSLGIEALKFDTLVAVPDGGTIIVGGPRGDGGTAILFAFTAKVQK